MDERRSLSLTVIFAVEEEHSSRGGATRAQAISLRSEDDDRHHLLLSGVQQRELHTVLYRDVQLQLDAGERRSRSRRSARGTRMSDASADVAALLS